MRTFVGILLLLAASLLQVTMMMRIRLLDGAADLVLLTLAPWVLLADGKPDWRWGLMAGLMVGYASALPVWVLVLAYGAAAGICVLLHRRIWQVAILTLVTSVLLGTLAIHLITMGYLWVSANPLPFADAINLITIPSMLLNLILVLPIYAVISEVNKLIAPAEQAV